MLFFPGQLFPVFVCPESSPRLHFNLLVFLSGTRQGAPQFLCPSPSCLASTAFPLFDPPFALFASLFPFLIDFDCYSRRLLNLSFPFLVSLTLLLSLLPSLGCPVSFRLSLLPFLFTFARFSPGLVSSSPFLPLVFFSLLGASVKVHIACCKKISPHRPQVCKHLSGFVFFVCFSPSRLACWFHSKALRKMADAPASQPQRVPAGCLTLCLNHIKDTFFWLLCEHKRHNDRLVSIHRLRLGSPNTLLTHTHTRKGRQSGSPRPHFCGGRSLAVRTL